MQRLDTTLMNGQLATSSGVLEADIWQSMAGIPGIQTMIPLLLSEGVNRGRIDLLQLVKITSEGPARV